MRPAFIFGLILIMMGAAATASTRISLRALSHDGSKAVLTYNLEWVEVDLNSGAAELIVPTVTCSFTSAAYAPDRADLALAAHCSVMIECAATRASLFTKPEGGRLNHILTAEGIRWDDAFWRQGPKGDEIILRETAVSAPVAQGLDQLGRDDCATAPATFTSVSVETGRRAQMDFLPKGWAAVNALAAPGRDLIATLRARNTGADLFTAERDVAAICAASAAAATAGWRRRICGPEGYEVRAVWQDGDWQLYDGPGATPLRRFVSADGTITADETCDAHQIDSLLDTDCKVTVTTPDGDRVIAAPDGAFGDLFLSADGRWLASLAGTGRFDLFNLTTGESTSLIHLLALSPPWEAAR